MKFVGKFAGLEMIGSHKFTAKLLVVSLATSGLLLACPTSRAAQRVQAQDQSAAAQLYLVLAQDQRVAAVHAQDANEVAEEQDDKKQVEQDRQSMMEDLYNEGQGYLDEGSYGDAARAYEKLARMNGPQTDAALYWKAYADNKLGKRDLALSSIADLKKSYPQSKWKKDAEALEIEIRQNSGRPVNPDSQSDDELKILALQGLMNNDPAQGIQHVEKFLNSSASPKTKNQALFLLVQSGSPQAQDTLAKMLEAKVIPNFNARLSNISA